ncbi:MAG: Bax inhibitor-1/YccA family protein [Faecalibacterium sp.]|jgi:FtsH-binding integral membrane protein|nr:Bax inhibitor-1/YccA family protein [Faecalibacterium sp.]
MYNDNNYGFQQNSASYGQAAQGLSYSQYLGRTFRWMTLGLLVTFAMSFATAYTSLYYTAAMLYLPLTVIELVLVFVLSARVQKMQVGTARALFLAYSALNGMVLSFYFVQFSASSLILAFLSSALYFGVMAVYGARTSRDLSGWGRKLMIALVCMIVVSLIGMLFGMGFFMSMLYSAIGLGIFMLLTAYDTQKIQSYYRYYSADGAMLEKSAIFSALSLYLDFINIFLYVLRFVGVSRRNN